MSSQSQNQKHLLCKKMNIKNCKSDCTRAHTINELEQIYCVHGINCNKNICPYVHPNELNINKQEYFDRMYNYISPYISAYTSVCRYCEIGCKIIKCRKAHSVEELVISECDCFRNDCPFYHENRDKNITNEQYFIRMKSWVKTLKKSNKNLLCRYINIDCQRKDCPYAHNISELNIHKCIFNNCKSTCVFLHKYETIDKQEYYERILKFIEPIKPYTVLCDNKNCKNKNCLYAHSYEQFTVSECIRGIKCKKHCCPFKHSDENLNKNTYYERMRYALYPN